MIWFKNLFDIWKKTIQSEKGPEFVWTFHKGDILKKGNMQKYIYYNQPSEEF